MTPAILTHDSPDELAVAAATRLLATLADLQAAGAVPAIALTGGSIAARMHREVARLSPAWGVDWGNVEIWWGDERFVAADSPDRNAGQARAAFLAEVGAADFRVHEMPAADGQRVEAAAAAYAAEFADRGPTHLDVVMLGVGPDGHVASLFPGDPRLDTDELAVAVTASPKPPPERVSLTLTALNRAREVWFLASGAEKAAAVAAALAGGPADQIPARGVSGSERTLWFIDREAAAELDQQPGRIRR